MREPRTIYVNPVLNIKPSRRYVVFIRMAQDEYTRIGWFMKENHHTVEGMFFDRNAELCDTGMVDNALRSSIGSLVNWNLLKRALSLDKDEMGLLQYIGDEINEGALRHKFTFYRIEDSDNFWEEFNCYRDNVMVKYHEPIGPVTLITPEERALFNDLKARFDKSVIGRMKYQLGKFKNGVAPELSPMRIDKDGVIWLDNYNVKLEFQPTHLAIYLHSLRHPEGIKRFQLCNYMAELSDIYRLLRPVSGSTNDTITRSERLRNRAIDNLFNETAQIDGYPIYSQYVSKINKKIKDLVPYDSVQYYVISGNNGREKKINLSLDFVSVEEGVLPGDFLSMTDAELHAWKPGGGRVTA